MSRRPVNRNIKRGAASDGSTATVSAAYGSQKPDGGQASDPSVKAGSGLAATLHRAAVIAETERERDVHFELRAVHPIRALVKATGVDMLAFLNAAHWLHVHLGAPYDLNRIPKRAAPLLFELGALVAGEQG